MALLVKAQACYANKSMKPSLLDQIVGWIGTAILLGGYILLSLGIFDNDWRYHASMFFGSIGLVWIAFRTKVWQVVLLNGVFATVALIALVRLLL